MKPKYSIPITTALLLIALLIAAGGAPVSQASTCHELNVILPCRGDR